MIHEFFQKQIKNNTEIKIIARVKFNRGNKKISFLTVNDGTTTHDLQIVCKADQLNNYSQIQSLSISSIIEIEGRFLNTPNGKQPFELIANEIKLLSKVASDYPLQKKEHSNEFLREIAHLRPRTKIFNAIFRMRSVLQYACHDFFYKNNFVNVTPPIITSNDAEGAGESFIATVLNNGKYSKDFFGKKASLTVSGQLHAESFAQAFRNVYTFAPAFRAENSNTTRHAAEFWMIEPEMAFCDINGIIRMASKFLKYIIKFILDKCQTELEILENYNEKNIRGTIKTIIDNDFRVITYTQAIELLQNALKDKVIFENKDIKWGMDLQMEHEKFICEKIYNAPIFIINYPKQIKAFYMKQNDDKKTVASFDLLVPGIGEVIGGSEREASNDKIKDICKIKNIDTSGIEWYLDLRRFGYYKSAGFGLGFERLLMYVTGVNNIRDMIPFPRTVNNLQF